MRAFLVRSFFRSFLWSLKVMLKPKVLTVLVSALIIFIIYNGKIIPSKIPFDAIEKEYHLNHNDLKAIMDQESKGRFLVVNTNDRNLLSYFFKGSKYFSYEFQAYFYMKFTLDTFRQNYDIGPFQINSNWIKSESIKDTSLELMNPFKSIKVSAKILSDNYTTCRKMGFKDHLSKCAFSMYNTGKPYTKSNIGAYYAAKVLTIRNKMTDDKFDSYVMYVPIYGYITF